MRSQQVILRRTGDETLFAIGCRGMDNPSMRTCPISLRPKTTSLHTRMSNDPV